MLRLTIAVLLLTACGSEPTPSTSGVEVSDDGFTGLNFPDTGSVDDAMSPSDATPPPVDPGGPNDEGAGTDSSVPPMDLTEPKSDLPDTPPLEPISGGVLVLQVDSSDLQLGSVSAAFRYGESPPPTPVMTEGACDVIYSNGQPPPPEPAPGLDAGLIEITGLNQPISMSPQNQNGSFVYLSGLPEGNKVILGSGANVGFQASGGQHVPAWAVNTAVPAPVTISSPGSGAVHKGQALTLQWNPGNGTNVRIDLLVIDGAAQEQLVGHTITCDLAADIGSHTVSSTLMNQLPGGGKESFPEFNFDYLVYGVTRVVNTSVILKGGEGTLQVAVTRASGGFVKLED